MNRLTLDFIDCSGWITAHVSQSLLEHFLTFIDVKGYLPCTTLQRRSTDTNTPSPVYHYRIGAVGFPVHFNDIERDYLDFIRGVK